MIKIRLLILAITILVVGSLGGVVSLYARGYRLDKKTLKLTPSGLLVAKSDPDSAQILINGELKTATNATINLAPGIYDLVIKKEGFIPWSKRLTIEKEVVTEASAYLIRSATSLGAITFSGVVNPYPSSDFTRIAYIIPPGPSTASDASDDKTGLWVLDNLNLPLGFAKEPKRITDGDLSQSTLEWSPDNRQILLSLNQGSYLLDLASFTPQNKRVNIGSKKEAVLDEWEKEKKAKLESQIKNLAEEIRQIFKENAENIIFSPDENKVLYEASDFAKIPEGVVKPLPGASTQKQERNIKPDNTYTYDIKEDRNFLVSDGKVSLGKVVKETSLLSWLPTSGHLVLSEQGKITVMDFDGTNRQSVFSGSYVFPFAFPSGNNTKLIILTNLGGDSTLPNLYSLSLK